MNHHYDGKFIAGGGPGEQSPHHSIGRIALRRGVHRIFGLDSLVVFGDLLRESVIGAQHFPQCIRRQTAHSEFGSPI